jgi:hypothetical protein
MSKCEFHSIGQPARNFTVRAACIGVLGAALASLMAPNAHADGAEAPAGGGPETALALRLGTPGIGVDFDLGLGDRFGARVGFSDFSISRTVNSSDASYDGKLKLSIPSALIDWYVFKGVFHLTAGVAVNGTKVDITGTPGPNGFTLNGNTYTGAEVSSVTGTVKVGNSAAPYVGFGWGNPTSPKHRVQVLFDVGAIYSGTPNVSLTAQCATGAPAMVCSAVQQDALAEEQKISTNVSIIKWYPVVNLGFSVRL